MYVPQQLALFSGTANLSAIIRELRQMRAPEAFAVVTRSGREVFRERFTAAIRQEYKMRTIQNEDARRSS